jgi:hypothetical protein
LTRRQGGYAQLCRYRGIALSGPNPTPLSTIQLSSVASGDTQDREQWKITTSSHAGSRRRITDCVARLAAPFPAYSIPCSTSGRTRPSGCINAGAANASGMTKGRLSWRPLDTLAVDSLVSITMLIPRIEVVRSFPLICLHYVLVSKLDKAQPASNVRRARILKRPRVVIKWPTAERAAIPDRQHRCRRQAL